MLLLQSVSLTAHVVRWFTRGFAALLLACAMTSGWPSRGLVVQGSVRGDTTWRRRQSPIQVSGDLVVEAGATLTIESGVEVVFGDGKARRSRAGSIEVRGALRAAGEPVQPIIFRGPRQLPQLLSAPVVTSATRGEQQWHGVVVADSATAADEEGTRGTVFRYCRFESACRPVVSRGPPVLIAHCWFSHIGWGPHQEFALELSGGLVQSSVFEVIGHGAMRLHGGARAEYCVFDGGAHDGVEADGESEFANCTFTRFAGSVFGPGCGEFYVTNCRLADSRAGIAFDVCGAKLARPHLTHCDFVDLGDRRVGAAFVVRGEGRPTHDSIEVVCEDGETRIRCLRVADGSVRGVTVFARQLWWTPPKRVREAGGAVAGLVKTSFAQPDKDPWAPCIRISGQVVDASRQPIPRALVWPEDALAPATLTDRMGRFTLEGAAPGRYRVTAERPGRGSLALLSDWAWPGGSTSKQWKEFDFNLTEEENERLKLPLLYVLDGNSG